MKIFYFFVSILIFVSCGKDDNNCVAEILGIYTGNCSSTLGTFQGDMIISESSSGELSLLIQDDMLDGGLSTYDATVSSDCETINVPSQSIIFPDGSAATISGTYQLNGTSLTGNLNIVFGTFGTICSYNLTKR